MGDNIYRSSNVYEWAAIFMAGGPSPDNCNNHVMGKMTVIEYEKDQLPERSEVEKFLPSPEYIATYNKFKHDVAFKKADEEIEKWEK